MSLRASSHLPALLLLVSMAAGTVLRVPEDFADIQSALDGSADGDTVRVARGTWPGLYTTPGHSLTLCSPYLFSQDSTDINETILDGEHAGTILDIVTTADALLTLCGFTMIRGLGTRPDIYAHCDKGGAINMEGVSNALIKDMVFRDCLAPVTAAILNHGDVCGVSSRGRLTIQRIACYNNRITAPDGANGCINIRSRLDSLIISDVYYDGAGTDSNPFYIYASRKGFVEISDVTLIDCSFDNLGIGTTAVTQDGQVFNNIRAINQNIGSGGGLTFFSGFYDIDSAFVIMKNIEISGSSFHQRQTLYISSSATHLQLDSLTFHHNRTTNPEAYSSNMLIRATQGGTLRHLHMHDNVSGDSTSQIGQTLLRMEGMDLVDSHIHDNRVILPPNPDPSGTGGNSVSGAMVLAWLGTRRFENLVFENNRVEDLDDYSNHVPANAYYRNWGRELAVIADTIRVRNVLVRNSRQPNACPEIYSPADIDLSGPGSTLLFSARKTTIENILLEDCDDGGISMGGDSVWVDNVVLRNVGRMAFNVGRYEFPWAPPYRRLRNVHIENVDASDNFLWPQHQHYSQQAVLFIDVLMGVGGQVPVVDLENVTVTGCGGMRHLFNFYQPLTLNVRNCVFWDNSYEQLVEWQFPIVQNWSNSVLEEDLPGEGNLIGVDPLFDPVRGAPYLSPLSPCIDAGHPDPTWNDREDPDNPGFALWPSLGTLRNDMGYTGGPHASLAPDTTWAGLPAWEPRLLPQDFSLGAPWPNPFNPVTRIPVTLLRPMPVRLIVHNLLGQEVAVLVDGILTAGTHHLPFQASRLASGVYLVTVEAAEKSQTRTVTLLR
jgi:hypothetical protein